MQEVILGLDIGGTKLAAGLLSVEGKLLRREEVPTGQQRGFAHSSGQMHQLVRSLLWHAREEGMEVRGLGACAPGPLDPDRGVLYNPPNLMGWENVPLRQTLEDRHGLPVLLDNDANAAGLAEAVWGAAAGYPHVFYVTVSTGIGTGIILNRRVFHGRKGMAGEGGHVTIRFDPDSPRCNCGNLGCIEAYASGTGAARRARRRLAEMATKPPILERVTGGDWQALTMKHIGRAALEGDEFSTDIIRETGTFLGIWLGSVVSLLAPDIIVLGGGVVQVGAPLFDAIRSELPSRTINPFAGEIPIVQAALEKDVGIYGAASLFMGNRDEAAAADPPLEAAEEVLQGGRTDKERSP